MEPNFSNQKNVCELNYNAQKRGNAGDTLHRMEGSSTTPALFLMESLKEFKLKSKRLPWSDVELDF